MRQVQITPGLMKIVLIPGPRNKQFIQLVVGETWCHSHSLKIDPDKLNRELLHITAKLNDMSQNQASGSLSKKRHELHGIGKKLFKLLPPEFLSEFAERSPKGDVSLGIQGQSQLPWELMADSNDDSFLAERLRISRWLHGHDPVSLILLRKAIFAYSEGIENAKLEIRRIGDLLYPGKEPTFVAEPEDLYRRFRQAISTSSISLVTPPTQIRPRRDPCCSADAKPSRLTIWKTSPITPSAGFDPLSS